MNFAKLNAPTLKELFVKELESKILSGQLITGQKLPSERELAEQMQVSRAVVNGGIAELARKGFVQVKPRSGVYVTDYRRYGTVETLLSIMNYNGGQLRKEEIRSILEIKLIIDRLAAELAVTRAEDEGLAALGERLETLADDAQTAQANANNAFEFYHELAMISGNALLPLIYRSFRVPVVHLWIRYLHKYGLVSIYENASAIYAALTARDRDAAVAAAEEAVAATLIGAKEIYAD